jgi:transcriptional regulator with XRE-family HTH domain
MFEEKNFFAENLRYKRQVKGMNLVELGEVFELGKSQISLYENGKSYPPMSVARKICKYFGVSLDEMFESDMRPQEPPKKGKIGYDENYNDRPNGNHAPSTATRAIAMNALGVSTEGESPPTEEEENITAEELKQMRKFLKAIKIAETI